ncbi:hypothetical protein ABIA33_003384 [Streptacidiphilus sp. MAP12-16]|uniref:hypothetical protein n=1 Tax=Streptacidiphilus sp. MAP12-16 TaxID=3156300 RepID=UPI003511A223
MNTSQRAASTALLCATLAAGATACGSGGTNPASQASPAAASAPAAPSSSAGPLDGLSAGEVATKAIANLKAAKSVRMVGNGKSSGTSMSMDVSIAPGRGCTGKISMGSSGSFEIVVIGTKVWMKPDTVFWKSVGGSDPATLKALTGKYYSTSAKSSGLGSLAGLCDLTKNMTDSIGNVSGATKGPIATVNGQKVIPIDGTGAGGTMDISDSATPLILRVVTTGADNGQLDFTDYNKTLTLTAPPAGETRDGAAYGM